MWSLNTLSAIVQFTPPRQTRHRRDCFVVSGVAVWIESAGPPDRCVLCLVWVGVCPAAQCDRRTHSDGERTCRADSIYTTTPDKTRPSRLPVDRRRDTGQAGCIPSSWRREWLLPARLNHDYECDHNTKTFTVRFFLQLAHWINDALSACFKPLSPRLRSRSPPPTPLPFHAVLHALPSVGR